MAENNPRRCSAIVSIEGAPVKDPVSIGLKNLATGLRPYVSARIRCMLRDELLASESQMWDAQGLLVFMWDHWNDLFRNELTFVERSLVSELRDFRNRWAHQNQLNERDVYRVLENIERLLTAIRSPEVTAVTVLRRESLGRLWSAECATNEKHERVRKIWPYLICGASACALTAALLRFGEAPWSWMLSLLLFLAMMRVAWLQVKREQRHSHGPRECSRCGRIVYSVDCPYCQPRTTPEPRDEISGTMLRQSGSWPGSRVVDLLSKVETAGK
ncbi:MAG: Swt1 family HEPN domain-containing protein [Planctomycetota bacterium]